MGNPWWSGELINVDKVVGKNFVFMMVETIYLQPEREVFCELFCTRFWAMFALEPAATTSVFNKWSVDNFILVVSRNVMAHAAAIGQRLLVCIEGLEHRVPLFYTRSPNFSWLTPFADEFHISILPGTGVLSPYWRNIWGSTVSAYQEARTMVPRHRRSGLRVTRSVYVSGG